MAKSIQAEYRVANSFAIVIEAPKRMPKASITQLLATFVLPHLLMQLGNVHASIPAALVLTINRTYSGPASLNFAVANQFLEAPLKQSDKSQLKKSQEK